MNKILSKEQVDDQRFAFAIKACYMMGYDAEKAVKKRVVKMLVYVVEYRIVKAVYCVHVFCPFWICT